MVLLFTSYQCHVDLVNSINEIDTDMVLNTGVKEGYGTPIRNITPLLTAGTGILERI